MTIEQCPLVTEQNHYAPAPGRKRKEKDMDLKGGPQEDGTPLRGKLCVLSNHLGYPPRARRKEGEGCPRRGGTPAVSRPPATGGGGRGRLLHGVGGIGGGGGVTDIMDCDPHRNIFKGRSCKVRRTCNRGCVAKKDFKREEQTKNNPSHAMERNSHGEALYLPFMHDQRVEKCRKRSKKRVFLSPSYFLDIKKRKSTKRGGKQSFANSWRHSDDRKREEKCKEAGRAHEKKTKRYARHCCKLWGMEPSRGEGKREKKGERSPEKRACTESFTLKKSLAT